MLMCHPDWLLVP